MRKFLASLLLLASLVAVSAPVSASGGDTTSLKRLAKLSVQAERRSGYKRALFPHWDRLSNRCYVREQVLKDEVLGRAQVDAYGCKVVAGDWFSVYDGVTVSDTTQIEIDHVVALAEAWDSGAWRWSAAKRRAFANDLSDPRTLRAVTGRSNQQKSDADPASWLPRAEFRCQYAADWVAIKDRWQLSVDRAERDALQRILRAC